MNKIYVVFEVHSPGDALKVITRTQNLDIFKEVPPVPGKAIKEVPPVPGKAIKEVPPVPGKAIKEVPPVPGKAIKEIPPIPDKVKKGIPPIPEKAVHPEKVKEIKKEILTELTIFYEKGGDVHALLKERGYTGIDVIPDGELVDFLGYIQSSYHGTR